MPVVKKNQPKTSQKPQQAKPTNKAENSAVTSLPPVSKNIYLVIMGVRSIFKPSDMDPDPIFLGSVDPDSHSTNLWIRRPAYNQCGSTSLLFNTNVEVYIASVQTLVSGSKTYCSLIEELVLQNRVGKTPGFSFRKHPTGFFCFLLSVHSHHANKVLI